MKPGAWLRRHDPDLEQVRRAVRVTLAVCVGFYACRYGLGDRVVATYALFAAIALGVLGRTAGPVRDRITTLLVALPVGAVLVTAGTVLARGTVPATAGMLVVGFAVSFAGVGGPRFAGLANGMQLLYVLACFPPYQPDTLGSRLAGLCVGVGLLALAEAVVLPDRDPVRYPALLADAADAVAHHLRGLAAALDGEAPADLADRLAAARAATERIRPSKVPPGVVPAGAGRRDRALSQAAGALRYALGLAELDLPRGGTGGVAAATLRAAAYTMTASAHALRGGPPPRVPPPAAGAGTGPPAQLADEAVSLGILDGVRLFAGGVGVATGAAPPPDGFPTDPFWYAHRPAPALWWERLRTHLTPRSVYLQTALRTAVALAAARVLAGVLAMQHGFWVVLATLTVMRTSAAGTRTAVVPALVGTLAGALAAAPVLVLFGDRDGWYAAITPVVMLLAFAGGVLFGPALGQASFTLLVAVVFAQLTPVSWRLAEVRLFDVLAGALVGVVVGVAAWPHGAARELRRAMAALFHAGGRVVRETVHGLARDGAEPVPTPPSMPAAQRAVQLADAAYAMFQSERRPADMSTVDWQVALVTGHELIRGSHLLRQSVRPGLLAGEGAAAFTAAADGVADAYGRAADALRTGAEPAGVPEPPVPAVPAVAAPDRVRGLVFVRVYLTALTRDLARLRGHPPR